jgi:hypothetical protein
LRHWRGTPIPGLLAQVPVLVFASAAALTLGSHTIPVYEIYKAGEEPRWEPGLGLFEQLTGCPAVIVPHYDNAEGGHHDTRFCYLGEDIIDLRARTVAVVGNGNLTLRQGGESRIHPAGTTITLADLADAHHGGLPVTVSSVETNETRAEAPSLREAADDCEASFSTALAERDVDGCVAAVLALSQSLDDWAADTLASPDHDHALGVLRGMVVRLGRLAQGALVGVPALVEAVLDLRRQAREGRDFAAADRLRDALDRAGIEVRDTPTGSTWTTRT